jgi:hypothetical protein
MLKTAMAYLDNLIAWGDSLFREDTIESINEATQIYVLAADLLGPKPQAVPRKGTIYPKTYADLKTAGLDEFSNALVALETEIPFDLLPDPGELTGTPSGSAIDTLGDTLYFCVPRNDKLLEYWAVVADRLFKIRNSLNIQGVFRQLPLFEPPIDPGLLARAAAAGLDIGAIVSGANQPLPLVRFALLLGKAVELCQEVKALGGALLGAMEKEDAEALGIMKARHERGMLEAAELVRYGQVQEATKTLEGLWASYDNARQRYTYYEQLLGKKPDEISLPEMTELDEDRLAAMKFNEKEPVVPHRAIEIGLAPTELSIGGAKVDLAPIVGMIPGGATLTTFEVLELALNALAQQPTSAAFAADMLTSIFSLIPQVHPRITPVGLGAGAEFGGEQLSKISAAVAAGLRGTADLMHFGANMSAKMGGYTRRAQDWTFQSNLAAGEISQIFKQIRAAQVRVAVAQRELENHGKQILNARAVETFLADEKNGKRTNQSLYAWQKRETRGLYGQYFDLAFEVARKAERALQHELGDPELSFLKPGYQGGREGLLSGEKLALDLKRMEAAYHDLHRREYELTRSVSVLQLDPRALLRLRETGRCTVFLPEALFDLDCPGHYFRRIKSVAVSIPCVVGPYASVNCTLRQLKSTIRKSPLLNGDLDDPYARDPSGTDPRFDDHFGATQAIVTSTAQNDAGLFEVSLRDERLLPFEGSGAISEWSLELPDDVRQFDYGTIADVILHVRYTAREGGTELRRGAVTTLESLIAAANSAGSARMFSIRHEFPTDWAAFKSGPAGQVTRLGITLAEQHYPIWSRGRLDSLTAATLFARASADVKVTWDQAGTQAAGTLEGGDDTLGDLRAAELANVPLAMPRGTLTMFLDTNVIEDLWLLVAWAGTT